MGTEMSAAAESRQRQVDRHNEAFLKELPKLIKSDAGRIALMRDGEVICASTPSATPAKPVAGSSGIGTLSIQKVRFRPLDLGYFSQFGTPRGNVILCPVEPKAWRVGYRPSSMMRRRADLAVHRLGALVAEALRSASRNAAAAA